MANRNRRPPATPRRRGPARTIACIGEGCVDYIATGVGTLPEWGRSHPIATLSKHAGGNAANCAIALAKIGASDPLPIIKLGRDDNGAFVLGHLREAGIRAKTLDLSVIYDDGMRTPSVLVLVQNSAQADRAFLHSNPYPDRPYDGSGTPSVKELQQALRVLGPADAYHFTGLGIFDALTRPEITSVLKQIRKPGPGRRPAIITADTAPVRGLREAHVRETLRSFLRHVDFFVPSDVEAALLTDNPKVDDYAESARRIRGLYQPRNVVVKTHEQGAFVIDAEGVEAAVPAFPLRDPVDTTGAGDAWCAGFLSAIVADPGDIIAACQFGNAAAHYCIQSVGATTSIPSFAALREVVTGRANGGEPSRPRVFLSYAAEDSPFVERLEASLERRGITVWRDKDSMLAGKLAPQALKALRDSTAFVLVVSAMARRSHWVAYELDQAEGFGLPVLPALLDDSFEDPGLDPLWSKVKRDYHAEDFRRWKQKRPYEASIARYLAAITRHRRIDPADQRPPVRRTGRVTGTR